MRIESLGVKTSVDQHGVEVLPIYNDDSTATAIGDLVRVSGISGQNAKVSKAGYTEVPSLVSSAALIAEPAATARYQDKAGAEGLGTRWKMLQAEDTSAREIGDLVFQAADGQYAFAAADGAPVGVPVGEVLTVSATAGRVLLDPQGYRWRKHREVTVRIPSAAVLTMNATPVSLVPAPGAGKAILVDSVRVGLVYGSAAYTCQAGEDLQFRYTNGSGDLVVATIDDAVFNGVTAIKGVIRRGSDAVLAANAPVVAFIATGEWADGDSDLVVVVQYQVVNIVEE